MHGYSKSETQSSSVQPFTAGPVFAFYFRGRWSVGACLVLRLRLCLLDVMYVPRMNVNHYIEIGTRLPENIVFGLIIERDPVLIANL